MGPNMDMDIERQAPKDTPSAAERIDEAEAQIPLLDAATFAAQVLDRPEGSLVIFYLADCAACHALFVRLRRLTASLAGTIRIFRVDLEKSRPLAVSSRIYNAPTLLVFAGGHERSRAEGLIPETALKEIIDSLR